MVENDRVASCDYQIALATRDDIADILALQEPNLRENGGALSARFSADWFEGALGDMPVLVARKDGRIAGYLVSSSKATQGHVPVIQSMLQAYPGTLDSYIYGPICVADSERGRGLPAALMSALHERLPGRQGITFIRRDNERSMRAHAKIGMREVAEFNHDGATFVVVSCAG